MHRRTFVAGTLALLGAPSISPSVRRSASAQSSSHDATPPGDASYARPELLADASWVQRQLDAKAVKVVTLTSSAEFEAGHIPGSAQIDWDALEIVETSDQSVATWRGEIEQRLTALGLAPAETVVVADGGTFYAARLWWILHQLGHRDVRILSGGVPAWIAAGGEIKSGPSSVEPASEPYQGVPDDSAIATLAEVEAALNDPNVIFVDARAPKEYDAGHLPGAVNIEFTRNGEPDQPRFWKPAAELEAMYADAGVTPDKMVIPYCTTGVRSAATYFTLRLLGYEQVTLFTGSWKEWSSHPELPVETGA